MKKVIVLCSLFAMVACAAIPKQALKTALDIAQIACIIAHAESDDTSIQKACDVADALIPDLRKIAAEQKAASRKYATEQVSTCQKDGGK